ncbi:flagellar protein FlgN [Cytobacillus sp. IB215665]|uniref:flagellar protein FlgN n=1 Tax=Cytobacillus sp. IB215665 TaxID=3097357 RepID=UPI002A0D2ECC|nr:flagellar protein FlgN [Cytobacillus sp. IB215665]MDX8363819.1 flagellar protein FlgN [Cytobacillus sp. IB215665]
MSVQALQSTLQKMYKIHKSLYDLGTKKTDIVKKGDIKALDTLLKDEQKHVAAIRTLDEERKKQVYKMVSGHTIAGSEPTVTDCIDIAAGDDKQQLIHIQSQLTQIINELKQQNELNQQLLYQSLQFVNISLDMLLPQPEVFNYEKPAMSEGPQPSRSLFDSKA